MDWLAVALFAGALMLFLLTIERGLHRWLDKAEARRDIEEVSWSQELAWHVAPEMEWAYDERLAAEQAYDPAADAASHIEKMDRDTSEWRAKHLM